MYRRGMPSDLRFIVVVGLIWWLFVRALACHALESIIQPLRELNHTELAQAVEPGVTDVVTDSYAVTSDLEDPECFGNRMEALELGRQCSRRCRKDVPCENTRKQCLCDGLCGMSCIKPDLSCPELSLENGKLYAKNTRFNGEILYKCNEGFYLFGPRTRLCQGDEDWSGIPGECMSEPGCRNPIKINHARNPNDGVYRLNDKVNYSCYPGYNPRGVPEAICRLMSANQTLWTWSGNSPFRCIPKSCGDPGQIKNGKRHGDSFIIASSVLYTCNEGYEMTGQARRYCQSDNQWSGQPPRCEPITCNPTDHLENGRINYAYPLKYNSTVDYECDIGFRIVGPNSRVCGPNRKLIEEAPRCEEIDCGHLGPLYNGYIKGFSSRMGDKKEFICMEGMKFVGDYKDTTCLETGNWSHPLASCLAPCQVPPTDHAVSFYQVHPDTPFNQNLSNFPLRKVDTGAELVHGSSLEIICEKEYEPDEQLDEKTGTIQGPICQNGTWSYLPECKPAPCKSEMPKIKDGRIRVASLEHGAKGFVHCLDGFRLKGDSSTTCQKGTWSRLDSTCQEIYCSFPGVIEHGRVLLVGLTGMYDYKPYIRRISNNRQIAYECENGYRLSDGAPNGATCMDGQWSPEGLAICVKE